MSADANTVGLVLSGGAAYAAYEVGVIAALAQGEAAVCAHRGPLTPQVASGTSGGAFNAALFLSQGNDAACAAEFMDWVWREKIAARSGRCGNGAYRIRQDPASWLNPACLLNPQRMAGELAQDALFFAQDWMRRGMRFLTSDSDLERRMLETIDISAFFTTEPLGQTIRETVDFQRLSQSPIALRIAATNWSKGKLALFDNGDFADPKRGELALMASSAVPGFFPPVTMDGQVFVDGGVLMNTPLKPAIRAGANELHVIFMDPVLPAIDPARLQSTISVFGRALNINTAAVIKRDIENAMLTNKAIDWLDNPAAAADVGAKEARGLFQALDRLAQKIAGGKRYRKLTIHLYHPREDMGGLLGLLDVDLKEIENLIARGYNDAVNHDCAHSGCVIPS